MSDAGRKDFSTQAKEKMTPDSSKSTTDRISENISGTADKAASGLHSDDSKGVGQEAFDKTRREKDSKQGGESVIDKAKDTLGLNK